MDQTRLTIFAPVDEAFEEYVRNFSDYSLIFRRHVVPRLLPWKDLIRNDDIATLPTFSEGFSINVTGSGDVLLLNGVPVIYPDMYYGNWLVVHGLNRLLMPLAEKEEAIGEAFSELDGGDGVKESIGDSFSVLAGEDGVKESSIGDSFSELGGEDELDRSDYGEYGAP